MSQSSTDKLVVKLRQVLEVAASVCVIIACAAFIFRLRAAPPQASLRPPMPVAKARALQLPQVPISLDGAATVGSAQAHVALLEFSDFQCPYCGRFALGVIPTLKSDFADPGKLLIAFRHLPLDGLHPRATPAAESAECARRQGKFWQMHNLLFSSPEELNANNFRDHARLLGLNLQSFNACLLGQATAQVSADAALAKALGITATPTILLGSLQTGNVLRVTNRLPAGASIAEIRLLIEALLRAVNRNEDTQK